MESKIPARLPRTEGNEPRAADRVRLDISIAYSLATNATSEADSPRYRWGTLVDISERGMCFKAADSFYVQRVISLYLKLSTQTSGIKMLGKVVWTGTDWDGAMRVGVQFIGTLPSDWRKLIGCE